MSRARKTWYGKEGPAETCRLMEGLLQKLRGTPEKLRPAQITHIYLAHQFGTSAQAMRKRYQIARRVSSRESAAEHFCDLWEQIGNVLGERVTGTLFAIATDPENSKAFDASRWILERTDPETYDPKAGDEEPSDEGSAISDVPQEVWDEMTPEEIEALHSIDGEIQSALIKLERLVRLVKHRLAGKAAQEIGAV